MDTVLLPWCFAKLTPEGHCMKTGSELLCVLGGLDYHRRVI